ncbi:MAG TPA: glycosyltransferase, partial [Gemmatales bacterium]|nr:glycosyltransferase [Gemmatales bacterium]
LPDDVPVVGTVGRLAPVKRQDLLLVTFREVLQHVPDCHLVIVGDGEQRLYLQDLARQYGLSDRIHFTGMLPEPKYLLQRMSAFVLTSESEGLPLALLEAWAVGVPVIAFAVGGLPEVIKHRETGYLVPFGHTSELAKQIIEVLAAVKSHKEVLQPMINRCQELVRSTYDVEVMARQYNEQYQRLLAARQH